MNISDLSYLETVSSEVFGGTSTAPEYDYRFKKKVDIDVRARYDIEAKVKGNSAEFTFNALAFGKNAAVDGEVSVISDSDEKMAAITGNLYAVSSNYSSRRRR